MKTNIGVFFGGRSTEHEISVISASQAMHAVDREKYDVTQVAECHDLKISVPLHRGKVLSVCNASAAYHAHSQFSHFYRPPLSSGFLPGLFINSIPPGPQLHSCGSTG